MLGGCNQMLSEVMRVYRISFLNRNGREIDSVEIKAFNSDFAFEMVRNIAEKIKGCSRMSATLLKEEIYNAN